MKPGSFSSEGKQNDPCKVISSLSWHSGYCNRFQALLLPAQHLKKIIYQASLLPTLFHLENLGEDCWLFVTCPTAYVWRSCYQIPGSAAGGAAVVDIVRMPRGDLGSEEDAVVDMSFLDLPLFFLSHEFPQNKFSRNCVK